MAPSLAPSIADLGDVAHWRARQEWFELSAMLEFRDAEVDRLAGMEPAIRQQAERSAIALRVGQAMRLSEGQVRWRWAVGDTIRDHAPHVWEAFADGLLDLRRVGD